MLVVSVSVSVGCCTGVVAFVGCSDDSETVSWFQSFQRMDLQLDLSVLVFQMGGIRLVLIGW